jgi:hypothetical protein
MGAHALKGRNNFAECALYFLLWGYIYRLYIVRAVAVLVEN